MNATAPILEAAVTETSQQGFGAQGVLAGLRRLRIATQPEVESAQSRWAMTAVKDRLRVLRAARRLMAADAAAFAAAISPRLARTQADTLVTELLPLLDACKFLEREAERLLRSAQDWGAVGGRSGWAAWRLRFIVSRLGMCW